MSVGWHSVIRKDHTLGEGGGLPYISYIGAAPSGRVFASFWSENEYTLYPFWSGIGYGF